MTQKNHSISRRNFIRATAAGATALAFAPLAACSPVDSGSTFGGVHIGVITYSWRSMPSTAQDIINYCKQGNITSLELMGPVAEEFAGLPPGPPIPPRKDGQTEEEEAAAAEAYLLARQEAAEKQKEWRTSCDFEKYKELKKMFDEAGIHIHTVKFSPANWSDEETDYAFKAAKVLGAGAVTNEIGDQACRRLGKFAEKHGMVAAYHNHSQPGEQPGFNFEDFLAHSPANKLNLDVGHYFGSTGKHPNELIEKLHDRIYSIHLKDKTAKNAEPSNTNRPWGEGDTPLADILGLIKKNKWPIYADIELEYKIPEGSDAQQEIIKCVEYCKNILV
ncbi:TIM barrel protein [Maribellus sp. YY47]|uniref:sugar phosphate isomerase/epimerase family protein n=1 Tax=Maribellus sp. YY47 TaxID=2929486 RepID=UPI0020014467|nr:TIM barrel protein [Maribellus sp. YY47]MCK3684565.1 sugar phosphate isomerase/epimerase [Maribellus sp. YY47]